jgi:putative flippase GtrA
MLDQRNSEVVVSQNPPARRHNIKRAGKFGLVGILNTGIDFTIYNLLSSVVGLSLIQSNIISTTISMMFSFLANKQLVFARRDGSMLRQAALFFAITAFGLYVLQTGTIKLLTDIWLAPVGLGLTVAHYLGINGHDQFLIKNGAKAIATLVSLTWNYIMHKKVVFSS